MKTRRRLAAAVLSLSFLAPSVAAAEPWTWQSHYPPDGDHPLRIAHYFVHPVGEALEWTVTRPLARLGHIIAPYEHIDAKSFTGCSRERPARSCTDVIK